MQINLSSFGSSAFSDSFSLTRINALTFLKLSRIVSEILLGKDFVTIGRNLVRSHGGVHLPHPRSSDLADPRISSSRDFLFKASIAHPFISSPHPLSSPSFRLRHFFCSSPLSRVPLSSAKGAFAPIHHHLWANLGSRESISEWDRTTNLFRLVVAFFSAPFTAYAPLVEVI